MAGLLAALMLAGLAPAVSATSGPIGVFKLLGSTVNSKPTPLLALLAFDSPPDSDSWPTVKVGSSNRLAFGFGEGDGLLLTGVPTAAQSTFTIEVWFEFDSVDGLRRILSFGPNDTDLGIYAQSGSLNLYNHLHPSALVFTDNQWVKVRVTRSAAKVMKIYVNGVRRVTYTDSLDEYLLRQGRAMFFQDDGFENGSGTVAQIKVWDRVVAP